MPTWAEVQSYVRTKYQLQEDRADSFQLVWQLQGQRFQAITVSRFSALDREWVEFTSAACKRDELSPEVALSKNFEFAVGGLALDGDVYVVRYCAQLGTLDFDELELPLHIVAKTADAIESEYAKADEF